MQNWVFLESHEILWTSGVACSSKDPGKAKGKCKSATWCSTKKVSKLNYTLIKSKKKDENCLALDIKTKKLIVANCKNTGVAICEVKLNTLYHLDLYFIFSVEMSKTQLPGRETLQEKCNEQKFPFY